MGWIKRSKTYTYHTTLQIEVDSKPYIVEVDFNIVSDNRFADESGHTDEVMVDEDYNITSVEDMDGNQASFTEEIWEATDGKLRSLDLWDFFN